MECVSDNREEGAAPPPTLPGSLKEMVGLLLKVKIWIVVHWCSLSVPPHTHPRS